MTISASLPTAISPFLGYIPNIFAAFVEVTSTNLFTLILFSKTPYVYKSANLCSTPGAPFGILLKSSIPKSFCPLKLNEQWSVPTV